MNKITYELVDKLLQGTLWNCSSIQVQGNSYLVTLTNGSYLYEQLLISKYFPLYELKDFLLGKIDIADYNFNEV